nr:MAG TPA: hypothetical protein [Caudoviricetes sp.]
MIDFTGFFPYSPEKRQKFRCFVRFYLMNSYA